MVVFVGLNHSSNSNTQFNYLRFTYQRWSPCQHRKDNLIDIFRLTHCEFKVIAAVLRLLKKSRYSSKYQFSEIRYVFSNIHMSIFLQFDFEFRSSSVFFQQFSLILENNYLNITLKSMNILMIQELSCSCKRWWYLHFWIRIDIQLMMGWTSQLHQSQLNVCPLKELTHLI